MPIYEYHCPDCSARKEHLQKLADAALTQCPACGGLQYTKQLSAAAFQLKGSGWYVTDFRGGNKTDKQASSAPATPASAAPAAAPAGGASE